jgi:hypothetical protein
MYIHVHCMCDQAWYWVLESVGWELNCKNKLEPGNLVLALFAYARTCTSHTKSPSKMHYIHFVYIYWMSERVRKRNVSILFKTINAAEVTSTLTLNRYFGSCSRTTSGQMVLPVKKHGYHLLFVWTSSTSHTKQNVSILSTHDDNWWHVSLF